MTSPTHQPEAESEYRTPPFATQRVVKPWPTVRDQMRPDGVVSCPRKGQTGTTIAWARCVEAWEDSPGACIAQSCEQHTASLVAIETRRPLGGTSGPGAHKDPKPRRAKMEPRSRGVVPWVPEPEAGQRQVLRETAQRDAKKAAEATPMPVDHDPLPVKLVELEVKVAAPATRRWRKRSGFRPVDESDAMG